MNFDFIAPGYDAIETFTAGGLIQRVRTFHLAELDKCARILIAGEGPGRFLCATKKAFPDLQVDVIESSRRMIRLAQRRLRKNGLPDDNVSFIHKDIRDWQGAAGRYDAIVTNFFLDCFAPDELARIIPTLAAAAAPDARWLVSDFHVPESGPARWRATAMLRVMYGFFRATAGLSAGRLTPPEAYLDKAGFHLANRRQFSYGLLQTDIWQRD